MATVRFESVSKRFADGTRGLDDVTIGTADGELLVCVGPSGSGKSTLLRILAGLDQPTAGDLFIGDRRINDLPPQARDVAMVFQNYALYPHMTVRGNLAFPLRMRRRPRTEIARRVADTARLLGLEELLARRPRQLSGGQRQRVAMGRALVRDPAVFLLDEPLSNLDAKLRVEVRAEIAALQRRLGTTTIYVTHDQVEAMTLGDRVAVLNGGRLLQLDSPDALYARPADLFVACFIGSPSLNLLDGRLIHRDRGLRLQFGDRSVELAPAHRSVHPELARHVDQPLLIGLRPESLSVATSATDTPRLTGQLVNREALGHEVIWYVEIDQPAPTEGNTGTARVACRLTGDANAEPGELVSLTFPSEAIYLFTPAGAPLAYPVKPQGRHG